MSGASLDAAALLAGPRGRSLCWHAADELGFLRGGRYRLRALSWERPATLFAALAAVLADIDLAPLAASDALGLCAHLARAVDDATYWQPPAEIDRLLDSAAGRAALTPVAEAFVGAPAAAWWASAVAGDAQVLIEWDDPEAPALAAPAPGALALWRQRARASEERCRSRRVSAEWWSAPIIAAGDEDGASRRGVVSTTRSLPGLGAVGLLLAEDRPDWGAARCWPRRAAPAARVAEVHGPADWRALAEAFPLELTGSRRGTWGACSGLDRRWVVPDWPAVAEEYDAVHVSVAGYLSTAGRALSLADGRATLLGGWNPDETYWLTDVLAPAGPPSDWVATERHPPAGWQRLGAGRA